DAKRALANEATAMLHGREAAQQAEAAARAAFQGGTAAALPTVEIAAGELAALRLSAALVRAGLAASNGEAKRLIEQGAVAVNDKPTRDAQAQLSAADVVDGAVKLTRGKTRHALLKAI
ncbi:MAG: S4 domain-containing protein, partial [Hyphomonadaceae bacterium]